MEAPYVSIGRNEHRSGHHNIHFQKAMKLQNSVLIYYILYYVHDINKQNYA